jgi:processive 1,2-diacylglycerol beta-glucosyltransferase
MPMARILIFYSSLGSGHMSAAQALSEAFRRKQGVDVQVEDALAYGGALFHASMTNWYLWVSQQAPHLYKMLYEATDLEELDDTIRGNRLLGMVERAFLSQLRSLVKRVAPDAIVCTQQIPALVLQQLKREGGLSQPLYLVITDFMVHSSWIISGVDGYFLPNELTRRILIARDLPQAILHVTGIPVSLEIVEPKSADAMRVRCKLPSDGPLITLFGAGIEPRRVQHMIAQFVQSPTSGTLAVVTGRDAALAKTLADLHDGPHMRLRKLGRIDYVDDLVAASDLVITKAGGLIVSEVLARGTPIIIIDPIPGQEEWNADFVVGTGAGIQLRMPESVPPAALYLLTQPKRLVAMRGAARQFGRPRAALEIVERVLAELRC